MPVCSLSKNKTTQCLEVCRGGDGAPRTVSSCESLGHIQERRRTEADIIKGVFGGEEDWNPSAEPFLWLYSRRVKAILDKKLAASVNILPKASSLYYWNGEIEEATEVLLLIKTKTSKIHMLSSYISVHGVAELDRTERLDWTLHSVMPCVVSAVQQSGSAIHVYLLFRVLSHHGLSPDTG
ncbi:uncharacterized protein LOC128052739 isoform X1 [Budorcas taxicolor]|uniref:uncharacterized protein LOC128052739 isoform X1 n=1 Tax=Budorcas taxicolor TaxID=37181 RepID=UPI00228431F7|nr:uncharacterized protein LOC128052739 isoform X1 [Budorcas taxicolor]